MARVTSHSVWYCAVALAIQCVTAVAAHHSNVGFDLSRSIRVVGTVTEFKWQDPHVHLVVLVDGGPGPTGEWVIQSRSPVRLRLAGWTKASVRRGDIVTIDVHPAKNGLNYGLLIRLAKDGHSLGLQLPF